VERQRLGPLRLLAYPKGVEGRTMAKERHEGETGGYKNLDPFELRKNNLISVLAAEPFVHDSDKTENHKKEGENERKGTEQSTHNRERNTVLRGLSRGFKGGDQNKYTPRPCRSTKERIIPGRNELITRPYG